MPPDKSISHRAALFAAAARGTSVIAPFLQAADTQATLRAVQQLGCEVVQEDAKITITSPGLAHLARLARLDCQNSGTTARLLLGLLAGVPGTFQLDGDASLRKRPMARITQPLSQMGATFLPGPGTARQTDSCDKLPFTLQGRTPLAPLGRFRSPVASAQVKSALLLASLSAPGDLSLEEPLPTRDHSERLLSHFGAQLTWTPGQVLLTGPQTLSPAVVSVPGDFSAASFLIVLALLTPESLIRIEKVGLNPTRTGLLRALAAMGAKLQWEITSQGPEPVGWVEASHSPVLNGLTLDPREVPLAIDELPLLALVGTQAKGETRILQAGELRAKESDRIAQTVSGLKAAGASIQELPDGFSIRGPVPLQGTHFPASLDHRMTMLFAIAACAATSPSTLSDTSSVAISFPDFFLTLKKSGVRVR